MNDNKPTHSDLEEHSKIQSDPQHIEMESLLDMLAKEDLSSTPQGLQDRVMSSVSNVIANESMKIHVSSSDQALGVSNPSSGSQRLFSMRLAAGLLIVVSAGISMIAFQPWSKTTLSYPQPHLTSVAFAEEMEHYLDLESDEHEAFDSAVTDWEIWANTFDSDLYADLEDLDLFADDGAL